MNALDKKRIEEIKENKNSGDTFTDFSIICEKCGSKAIHIQNIEGGSWSEYTQDPAELVFKCKECGNHDCKHFYS